MKNKLPEPPKKTNEQIKFWIAYEIENYGYTKQTLRRLELFHGIEMRMHDLVKITQEEVRATLKEQGY